MLNILKDTYMMRRGGGTGGGGGGTTTPPANSGGGRTFTFLQAPANVDAVMSGSVPMADGTSINTWRFGSGFNNDRTVPSPVIEANQGTTAQITLSSMMPHTIHLHGLDVDQQNDGVPSTSFAVGGMGGIGNSYTYTFKAPHAGTYMYHCHVDTNLHFEMGMFGTIIIRPTDGSTNRLWDNGPNMDKEYIWQLTTFDSTWHGGMGGMGGGSNLARYRPDYFMINGRDGSNTRTDTTTAITASAGQRVLVRLNGTSYMPGIVRMGGLAFEVVASDGRPLAQPFTTTEQLVSAGERYDIILTMPASGQYTGSIEYRDIRNATILGTATTTITVV
ncbi:MAG: multicopper oxidase domain-containing protein [Gammaproteobacteria bacterium]|nr:multicopper oxidase domain-containing protein [Gammaproteobacteria bacterium]